ncbi:MAG: formyltransferase family protein [Flavobacteriales bacterium]|nr:hypothetical protein [Flavobacteriales bacterium]MCX7769010.1 formyltransferase family protein [Flavobacteriales bacterium]MDW8410201.1 formyltransferase family protein [Flavobacteriales bacterium]
MRYVYAGDRQIAVNILKYLLDEGLPPLALLLEDEKKASHNRELQALVKTLQIPVFVGDEFKDYKAVEYFKRVQPHYFLGIHFPKIIPKYILEIPLIGFLNLHPAYLPYNRGWHTPSWALLEKTPFGATLHFMEAELDCGDIVHQKRLVPTPDDTAHSLYQKVLQLEEEVFREALPSLRSLNPPRKPQEGSGTLHRKSDLQKVAQIDLNANVRAGDLIDKLRALTTNRWEEGAWFEVDGKRYYVQIVIRSA